MFGKRLQTLYGISLEQAGCTVDCALDNDDAMRLYQTHGPHDLVLTHIFQVKELIGRIRKINPVQPLVIVGSCSASTFRFRYKVPVWREWPHQLKLVRLVESAIKPQVKVLLVMAKPNADIDWKHGFGGPRVLGPEIEGDGGGWYMAVGIPESFEIDLQSDGAEALKHYRERGPYDLVLSDLRLPGLSGPDLGAAIRAENRGQRIVLMTEARSVGPDIRKQLGEIPLLNLNNIPARRPQKRGSMKLLEDSEGKRLLDWVEAGLKVKPNRTKSSKSRV